MKNITYSKDMATVEEKPKKKATPIEPSAVVLLNKKEIQKMIDDYQSILSRCEKMYEVRSLKQINDLVVTLSMAKNHLYSLLDYSE